MHVLVIGAAGMVGRKFVARLCADRALGGRAISRLTAYDVIAGDIPDAPFPVDVLTGDFPAEGEAERLIAGRPDIVVHLAAVVSGEAETDFDKGYRINLHGSMKLLEAIRAVGGDYRPRVVFASSIAVFGAPFPEAIPDTHHHVPLTSYGTQKAVTELLLHDYARRGFLDGIGLRLPTIVVRPGVPNKAASGFFSNILREPLNGKEAVLPVADSVRHWMASPRAAVGFLVHAATMPLPDGVNGRSYTMPGVAATVAEMIAALERVAGPGPVSRIRRQPDPFVDRIVSGWPRAFEASAARDLGFVAEPDMDTIIRIHIDDELDGTFVA